ncbi:MAG: hypothetical protein IKG11_05290 [Atopobiaceae bacterium]|nr:hypothetical protein [Atopobiaceae bacterium]
MSPYGIRDGQKPSYLMVKAGTWGRGAKQLHRFFAWDEVSVGHDVPFWVATGDCVVSENDLVGRVTVTPSDALGRI